MISYTWCRRPDQATADQASALVDAAARYDDEAGFAVISPQELEPVDDPERSVWHLPVTARLDRDLAAEAPAVLVAFLLLTVDTDGHGTVKFTVHPRHRSRGVATMLVEELGLDVSGPDGWCGTGARSLRCWAYGSHPAAQRLTRRFDIAPVARLGTLLRHLTGPFAAPLRPAAPPDGVLIDGPLPLADTVARAEDVLARSGLPRARRDRVRAELADGSGELLIATAAGHDVGFAWCDPQLRPHLELRAGWVRALLVVPDMRGAGVGPALLTPAIERLRAAGAQLALMRIDPADHGAVRMTRLLSFEQEETHTCYQVGTARADVDPGAGAEPVRLSGSRAWR